MFICCKYLLLIRNRNASIFLFFALFRSIIYYLIFPSQQSFVDVVDPLDFEEFILQHQPLAEESDGVQNLAEFPDDDIEVTTVPRKHRTVETSIPKDIG